MLQRDSAQAGSWYKEKSPISLESLQILPWPSDIKPENSLLGNRNPSQLLKVFSDSSNWGKKVIERN
jgi:hypothetical protein